MKYQFVFTIEIEDLGDGEFKTSTSNTTNMPPLIGFYSVISETMTDEAINIKNHIRDEVARLKREAKK